MLYIFIIVNKDKNIIRSFFLESTTFHAYICDKYRRDWQLTHMSFRTFLLIQNIFLTQRYYSLK